MGLQCCKATNTEVSEESETYEETIEITEESNLFLHSTVFFQCSFSRYQD